MRFPLDVALRPQSHLVKLCELGDGSAAIYSTARIFAYVRASLALRWLPSTAQLDTTAIRSRLFVGVTAEDATCRLSITRTTFGTLFAAASALALISAEFTCPASVTTPFVELTEILVTVDKPMSEANLDFTWAVISTSSTCLSGDSLVRQATDRIAVALSKNIVKFLMRILPALELAIRAAT
jgi:hypothetical protein